MLIFTIVVVGGVTRLTRSGLSMVEWKPIKGVLPPLNQADWEKEFEKYKQYPEYKKLNQGMSLADFKFIFFWEFIHRILGRLVGLVFFIPFMYFWWRGKLRGVLARRAAVAFVLGGMQGLLGWFMVKSGLVNQPHVSHYRLAAHLLLAFFIIQYILWLVLDLARFEESAGEESPASGGGESLKFLRILGWSLTGLITLQILYGAFTAGLRAGYVFNTFPLMKGALVPAGLFAMSPGWSNLFENPMTVQFIHRCLGYLIVLGVGVLLYYGRAAVGLDERGRKSLYLLGAVVVLQFILGILTLVLTVPLTLASLHQAGALVLLCAMVYVNYNLADRGEMYAKIRAVARL